MASWLIRDFQDDARAIRPYCQRMVKRALLPAVVGITLFAGVIVVGQVVNLSDVPLSGVPTLAWFLWNMLRFALLLGVVGSFTMDRVDRILIVGMLGFVLVGLALQLTVAVRSFYFPDVAPIQIPGAALETGSGIGCLVIGVSMGFFAVVRAIRRQNRERGARLNLP
jgi:hypothetical protein